MAKIFINYRRADSITVAFIIYNKLLEKKHSVFIDKEAIPVGFDFAAFIKKKIREYDVMLTLIGNQWLTIRDDQKKIRIRNAGDHVRLELAEALQCGTIKVIPVLIDKTQMPGETALPNDLKDLPKLNAVDFFSYEYERSAERVLVEVERTLNLLKSKDISRFISISSIKDDRGVVHTLKAAMEANLLADKNTRATIDFKKLDEDVLYVSKLERGLGTYLLSALYAAEQFGVHFTSWKPAKKEIAKDNGQRSGRLKRYTINSIDEVIMHLNTNRPVMAVSSIFEKTWYHYTATSENPIPFDSKSVCIGQQAILISQVDLVKNRIRFAVLWGKSWGDKGFGYFTEESFYEHVKQNELFAIETIFS